MLMAAMGVQAQVLNQTGNTMNDGIGSFIPSSYSSDGKAYLVIDNDDYDEDRQLIVYDDKLNKVKTINVPAPETHQSYNVIKEREMVIIAKLWRRDKEQLEIWEDNVDLSTLDGAKTYLAEHRDFRVDSISVVEDSTFLFTFQEDYYYYHEYDQFGRKYPTNFYAYVEKDAALYGINQIFSTEESYTGEWTERTETDTYKSSYNGHIGIGEWYMNGANDHGGATLDLSQTLFNNDDTYEYIAPIYTLGNTNVYEGDRDYDGVTDRISYHYSDYMSGFKIVSDNGNTLQTVNMPENTELEEINLYSINDEKYICCSTRSLNRNTDDSYDYYSIFYTITPGSGTAIKQVGEPMKTKVRPTIADRNETITVELDGNGNGEKEIFVSNAAGQTVYKTKVAAGQKTVKINASGLSRGMNVISVKGSKGKADNNKVFVK